MKFVWMFTLGKIEMESESVESPAPYRITGYDGWVEWVQFTLQRAYGMYGHTLAHNPSPIDLHYAVMVYLKEERPVLVEGQEAINSYKLDIPEGAMP